MQVFFCFFFAIENKAGLNSPVKKNLDVEK